MQYKYKNVAVIAGQGPLYLSERGAGHGMGRGHTMTREIGCESEQYCDS